jgi:hypothetical protein
MRSMLLSRVSLALVLATSAGCDDGILPPRVNFADAIAMPACGPADGGAVAIYLTSSAIVSDAPAPPFLRVDIWRTLAELGNQTFPLGPGSESATAHYFASMTSSTVTPAAGGSVTVTAASAEGGIQGEITALIPDHGMIRGNFSARWIPQRTTLDLCG